LPLRCCGLVVGTGICATDMARRASSVLAVRHVQTPASCPARIRRGSVIDPAQRRGGGLIGGSCALAPAGGRSRSGPAGCCARCCSSRSTSARHAQHAISAGRSARSAVAGEPRLSPAPPRAGYQGRQPGVVLTIWDVLPECEVPSARQRESHTGLDGRPVRRRAGGLGGLPAALADQLAEHSGPGRPPRKTAWTRLETQPMYPVGERELGVRRAEYASNTWSRRSTPTTSSDMVTELCWPVSHHAAV